MHPAINARNVGITALIAVLLPLYLVLPLSQGAVFASPDETANAAVIRELSWYGRAFIPETLAVEFSWLHPRSFVSRGETIVPVGFLGWPWVLSVFALFLGQAVIPMLASLIAVSMAYPLYRLMEKPFGDRLALLGTFVAMTVPGLIVFGNRALFPQLAVLAFGLWSIWLLRKLPGEKRVWPFAIVGCLIALAFASRPTELPWLLPWLVWAGWESRPTKKQIISAIIFALIPLAILGYHAQQTYGGFWKAGYAQRDNISTVVRTTSVGAVREPPLQTATQPPAFLFPFGFHPKNILRNVRFFLVGLMWPWMILLLIGAGMISRDIFMSRDTRHATRLIVPGLALCTVLWLLFYYGQGLYSDNINGGATIANSFIRYLLPLGPIIGLAFVFVLSRVPAWATRRVAPTLAIILVIAGIYMAFGHDEEGMLATRTELLRYHGLREVAAETFGPKDVILSERSDKIFYPLMRAVSPLPTTEQVRELAATHSEVKIGLFARPLSQSQADDWRKAGFDPLELTTSGREKLYLLRPIRR